MKMQSQLFHMIQVNSITGIWKSLGLHRFSESGHRVYLQQQRCSACKTSSCSNSAGYNSLMLCWRGSPLLGGKIILVNYMVSDLSCLHPGDSASLLLDGCERPRGRPLLPRTRRLWVSICITEINCPFMFWRSCKDCHIEQFYTLDYYGNINMIDKSNIYYSGKIAFRCCQASLSCRYWKFRDLHLILQLAENQLSPKPEMWDSSSGRRAATSSSCHWHDCLCSHSYTVQLRLCFCMNPEGFGRDEKDSKLLDKIFPSRHLASQSPSPWCVFSGRHHHSAPLLCGGSWQQISISQTFLGRLLLNLCFEQLCHSSLCSCRESLLSLPQVWGQKRKAALCKLCRWGEPLMKVVIWTQSCSFPLEKNKNRGTWRKNPEIPEECCISISSTVSCSRWSYLEGEHTLLSVEKKGNINHI